VVAIAITVGSVIAVHGLWERAAGGRVRDQVAQSRQLALLLGARV
jgi:hypothetical protein